VRKDQRSELELSGRRSVRRKLQRDRVRPVSVQSAKAWAATLIKDRAPDHSNKVNSNVLKNGPPGYHCGAGSSKQGNAYSGECTKGPVFNPTSGFSWGPSLH
jgi:hypothetical protein